LHRLQKAFHRQYRESNLKQTAGKTQRKTQTTHLLCELVLSSLRKNNKFSEQWRARRGFSCCSARFATSSERHSLTRARILHLYHLPPSSYGFSAFASWSRGGESPQTRAGRGGSRGRGMHGKQPLSLRFRSQWPRAAASADARSIGMCTLSLPEHHQQRP
jgi:hypothetical protein